MGKPRAFDWRRDVGKIDPCQVEDLARRSGKSLEEFARDFVKQWPFGNEATEDQIREMVAEMRRCPHDGPGADNS